MSDKAIIIKDCERCGTVHELVVQKSDIRRVVDGMHIQEAMPYLTSNQRELMISGICGDCFDEIFKEGDDA